MVVKESEQHFEGVLLHQGIGIDQAEDLAAANGQGLIVGPGETAIHGIGQQPHLRKPFPGHGCGAVGGCIIDHDDLVLNRPQRFLYRDQGLFQELPDIVTDDDDAQLQGAPHDWLKNAKS